MAGANRKKARKHKVSKGEHGATRHRLDPLEKALLGKGAVQRTEPVECKSPWRGARDVNYPLFNKEQAEINREMYPHLFDWN